MTMAIEMTGQTSRLSGDRMSLLTKIARMYHEQGMRQPEIADRLHISQSRVSRFLKEAVTLGVVRTIVVPPPGVHPDLEEAIRDRFGLIDVVVAESADEGDASIIAALGQAGAAYLETTLNANDRVGISSWSSTLLATVDSMTPRTIRTASEIVQVIGGVGNPSVQVKATHLTDRFARVTGAVPRFFPAPGIVASEAVRNALLEDAYLSALASEWTDLSVVLAGIGSLQPSPLLKDSGNAISEVDMDALRARGAVGDVCLRFFDADGVLVDTELNNRVVGISSEDLLAVPRTVGIAGGERKFEAIRAAARGRWINVLITDLATAQRLVEPGR
jgi:DNA-binding transcriptional regulator LsrR (DeoR family)